ncbi:CLUMA_CG007480, isoform A [Clunio marinus]|uniref:CLUMA_CG007480, isoform A n=1 Tax=Clunio marinus TaxID=568069 RepID=A0A1J1I6C5_9DIPT|nr:CLUMA_CG007480, isoform A [Clunio marinus]
MEFLSNIKEKDELLAILHIAIDRIYKKETSKKYSKYSEELDYISNVYTEYCSDKITKSELLEYFPIEEDLKEYVVKAIELRKPKVFQHLIDLHNSSQIPLMKFLDWDLNFVLGNSLLASFRQQFATLIFNCMKGKETEFISVEINRDMLNKMIQELELVSNS